VPDKVEPNWPPPAPSAKPSSLSDSRRSRWVAAASVALVAVVVAGVGCQDHRSSEAERWSALPHTMVCEVTPPQGDPGPPDPNGRFERLPDSFA
jgi:hypothetical protein